jgi:hypothetical protein
MSANLDEFEKHNALRANSTAPHLVETLNPKAHWQPYPVLPPMRYAKPTDIYFDAPRLDLGPVEVRCHQLLGSLRIPFYLEGDQALEYGYRLKP